MQTVWSEMCKGHQSERFTALVFLDLDKSSEQEISLISRLRGTAETLPLLRFT